MAVYPIHFFTEPQKLATQTANLRFGPVSDTEYRSTCGFTLTSDAKAFAVFSGNVMLFDNYTGSVKNETLVNMVLWPIYQNSIELNPGLKFIVYRGLKRSDFMTGSPGAYLPVPSSSGNIDFVEFTYAKFKESNERFPTTGDDLLKLYSYLPDAAMETVLWNHYTSNPPLAVALKSSRLGTFTKEFGLGMDFFLNESFIVENLKYITADEFSVKIDNFISRDLPGKEIRSILAKRETIKQYIDPCVFYHLHRNSGIGYEGIGNSFNFTSFYTLISKKFYTCNTIYIDIRNNNDYSLNYYNDNEFPGNNHVKIGFNLASTIPISYYTNYWPIRTLDDLDTTGSIYSNAARISFIFNCIYNPNPVLYFDLAYNEFSLSLKPNTNYVSSFKYPIENQGKFLPVSVNESTQESISDIHIYIPTENSTGPTGKSIAFLVKLYWLRDKPPLNIIYPPALVALQTPLDNIFGDISSIINPDTSISSAVGPYEYPPTNQSAYSKSASGLKKKFIPEGEGNAIGRMVQTGVGFSSNDVTFFAVELDKNAYSFDISQNLDSTHEKRISNETSKHDEFKLMLNDVYNVDFKKTTVNSAAEEIYSLEPSPKGINGLNINSFYSLSFSKEEIQNIHAIIRQQGFAGGNHTINFAMDLFEKKKDPLTTYYYGKGRLKLNGMDANGNFQQYDLLGINTNNPVNLFYRTEDRRNYFSENAFLISAIYVREEKSDPNAKICIAEYIKLVEKVEAACPNETCSEIITRIRSHYYGFNDFDFGLSELLLIDKFNIAIPFSPWMQAISGLYSWVRLPFIDYDSFKKITAHADENGIQDNPSPYIEDPSGNLIDAGHLLYGLDGLIVSANFKNTGQMYKNFQVYRSNDLTGYIADVFTPAAESRVYKNNLEHKLTKLNYPNNNDLARIYKISAPEPDLLSDVDPFGLYNTYNYLKNKNPEKNIKFSEVLALYYNHQFEPLVPLAEQVPPNYKYRWLNFCKKYDCTNIDPETFMVNGQITQSADGLVTQYQGFVEFNAATQKYDWVATGTESPSNSNHISIVNLRIRGEVFAHFWYQAVVSGAKLYSAFGTNAILFLERNNILKNQIIRFERPNHLTITGILAIYIGSDTDPDEVNYCIDTFITWVKKQFEDEKRQYQY